MLCLSRFPEERIVFPTLNIEILCMEVSQGRARLGITAPADVPCHRYEVYQAILREQERELRRLAAMDDTQRIIESWINPQLLARKKPASA